MPQNFIEEITENSENEITENPEENHESAQTTRNVVLMKVMVLCFHKDFSPV